MHHNQHDKIRLVGVVTIAMVVGLVTGVRRAPAQSDDSSTPASDSSIVERALPPGAESPAIDAANPSTVPDDAMTANPIDDSPSHGVSDESEVEYGPSRSSVTSEASESDSEDGAVLELPQVINLPNGTTPNRSADGAFANSDDNDDDTAQSSPNGQDTAGDHELAARADQLGTLQDYENQTDEAPGGMILSTPAVTVLRFPRQPLFNPLPRPPFGMPMATSPIILPPTSSGPFPSTSPMLMAPRFGAVGSFPSRGLMGAHR